MAKILMDKYNEFPKETKLWSWAMAREDERRAVASRIHESHEEGISQGFQQGMNEGLRLGIEQERVHVLSMVLKKKYRQEASEWLKTLTLVQLEKAIDIVLEVDDFTTFKQVVEKIE